MTAPPSKADFRARMRQSLAQVSGEDRAAASLQAQNLLLRQAVWKQARAILFYAPLKDEIDLLPLAGQALREGKIAALPRFAAATGDYSPVRILNLDADLASGKFGIPEPSSACEAVSIKQLDLILAPGLAFGRNGERLGRGKGFYDRLLSAAAGLKCGVALPCQVVDRLPLEPHDILVDCILTPDDWLVCRAEPVLK